MFHNSKQQTINCHWLITASRNEQEDDDRNVIAIKGCGSLGELSITRISTEDDGKRLHGNSE